MAFASALIEKGRLIEAHRPWPRILVDEGVWREAILATAVGEADLLSLWSDGSEVHMALLAPDNGGSRVVVASLPVPAKTYPSVGATHPPALRLERTLRDLYGIEAEGLADTRPWLDHNRWGLAHPLGDRATQPASGQKYDFRRADGPPLHQIPVGPVHAGIIEPGHFRFHANGETVVRLEERLGYVHKGVESLFAGATLEQAGKLAGRISGDSTVAYAFAFAMAVEAALGIDVPARASHLRVVMAELERLANHFGDIGAICNDASFSLMHAHCHALREQVLRAASACFQHRLMMDRVVPGGVAVDMSPEGPVCLSRLVDTVRGQYPQLVELYDNTASLQNRTVGTGFLSAELARRYAAGGVVGRASGRAFDTRRHLPYAPYGDLSFATALRHEGDVDARIWVRFVEIEQSLSLIEQVLAGLPAGAVRRDLPAAGGGTVEGLALTEAFRGDVLAFIRIGPDRRVLHAHLRDASWFQWPLLEAAIEGNIVADFPLCNKSFNCSYSGHDL